MAESLSASPVNVTPAAPDYDTMWGEWKATPGPEANAKMLRALDPVIDRAAQAHVGKVNPLVRSRARTMTLQGLATYDPKRGRLQSHLFNHLQGLKRYNAQSSAGLRIPERVMLDRRAVEMAAQELQDTHGREANDDELSDYTGLSAGRVRHVRTINGRPMSSGYFSGMGEGGEGYDPAVKAKGPEAAWRQVVYGDLSPTDKKIFEYADRGMQNQEIAKQLKLSPGRISQRKMLIQSMLDRENELSPF